MGSVNADRARSILFLYHRAAVFDGSCVVNLVNSYNGLQSGLSTLLIFFLTVKALMTHSYDEIVYIAPIYGALVAFLWYNKYPSRLFEGNVGSLAVGAAIGRYIIMLNDMEVYGVIILIPHIAIFLMYVYWRVKKVQDNKSGRIREDGTLDVPNPLTFKWVLPYYMRMTEQQATTAGNIYNVWADGYIWHNRAGGRVIHTIDEKF